MEANFKRFLEAPGKQIVLYIAGGVAAVLMAVVIFCNLLLIVSNIREPNQMPSAFGIRPAIVLSGSMSPAFEAGDVIFLKKTKEPDKLNVGDVACYLYSGKATTHRVIERFEAEGKPRYIMKGDYNNVEDRLAVDPEQIQGVWNGGRVRHLGSFLMFLQSTMGMFVFLICPLAGVLAWDILKRRNADRLRRECWENGEALEYGENHDMAETGILTAFRRILEHRTEKEPRRREREFRWRESEPYGFTERRAEEAAEEEELPRPSRRRQPIPARERPGEFYRPVESYEPWEQAAAMERSDRPDRGRRSRLDRDDEFYYYSQLDDDLDYYQELEEAAEHYRKMKESLKRYKRMEAVMNRCRRLEEELSRYEALADRLEAFERANLHGRQNRHAGTTGNGVSDQGARQEPPRLIT